MYEGYKLINAIDSLFIGFQGWLIHYDSLYNYDIVNFCIAHVQINISQ